MPISSPSRIGRQLSVIWTPQRLISEVRVLTNELDNERVQDLNIRNHINVCVSNIAEMLNMVKNPYYGISWEATLDYNGSGNPPAGEPPLPHIKLDTLMQLQIAGQTWTTDNPSNTQFAPYSLLWEINRVGYTASGKLHNCQRLSQEEVMHLNAGHNLQSVQTICWNHHGDRLYFYIGSQLSVPTQFWIFGFRNPVFDDLKPESTSTTYTAPIDLPDRHIRLLLLMTQKMVLEQVNKQVDPNLDASIQQMTNQIMASIVQETQFAEAQRTKQEYGLKTR